MASSEWLRRRNALWQRLRELSPGDSVPASPEFEVILGELCALIGWDRQRVLAGLALSETPGPENRS
jgi:hypothetical protein